MKPRDAERSKNFFALGLVSWMYTRPVEPTVEWIEAALRVAPAGAATPNLAAFKAGYNFGETAELFDHPYEVAPARLDARPLPQHHRQPRALVRDRRRPCSRRSCRCSTRRTRSRPRPTSCTSCSKPQELRRAHAAGRGRDRGGRRRHRRGVRRPARRHRHERPRRRPEVGGARARDQPRAAARPRRRAARRAVDRSPHEDRAGRPAARDVRAPRRGAAADRRGTLAEPLLRRRVRGRAHRAEVPDAGHPPHRRLPRQRCRAVAAARRRRAARHLGAVRDRAQPHRDDGTMFWPYLRDPETLARPWAIPGTPGLQHRIGGIEKQDGTGNVNYDPENHEHMVRLRAEKVARDRERHPRASRSTTRRRRRLLVLGWGSTWGVAQQAVRQARARAGIGARAAHAPQPVPARTSATCSRATRRCSCRR